MTQRRGWGEHSVFRRADGVWVGQLEAGKTADGKRRRITRKAKTKAEVLRKLKEAERQLTDVGFVPDQRTTVRDFLAFWSEEVLPGTVKESTAAGYRQMMDHYVVPAIGDRPLAKLDPADVQRLLRKMEADGLSVSTRRQVRAILRSALTRAERFGYVTRNAAALVDPPKGSTVATKKDDTLSPADVRKLLTSLTEPRSADKDRKRAARPGPDRLLALAEVACRLGLRKGELLALRWDDVDLKARTLRVAGTLKRRPGGGYYVDTPKTSAGTRVLPLGEHLASVLKVHKRRQAAERLAAGEMWQDDGFVFTTTYGAPLEGRNLHRWWFGALEDAKLSRRPFHATRRTAVTNMAEAGVPLEVAAALVGHSGIRMAAEVYNRVRPKAQADAVALLEAHLGA